MRMIAQSQASLVVLKSVCASGGSGMVTSPCVVKNLLAMRAPPVKIACGLCLLQAVVQSVLVKNSSMLDAQRRKEPTTVRCALLTYVGSGPLVGAGRRGWGIARLCLRQLNFGCCCT